MQRQVFNIKATVELPLFFTELDIFQNSSACPPPPPPNPRHPARKSFCGPWQVKTFGILLNYNMQTKIGAEDALRRIPQERRFQPAICPCAELH